MIVSSFVKTCAKKHKILHTEITSLQGARASTIGMFFADMFFADTQNRLSRITSESDQDKKDKMYLVYEALFGKVEETLGEGDDFICGDEMTLIDLMMAVYLKKEVFTFYKIDSPLSKSKFPKVANLCDRVYQCPEIKAYMEKNPFKI